MCEADDWKYAQDKCRGKLTNPILVADRSKNKNGYKSNDSKVKEEAEVQISGCSTLLQMWSQERLPARF